MIQEWKPEKAGEEEEGYQDTGRQRHPCRGNLDLLERRGLGKRSIKQGGERKREILQN